MRIFIEPTEPLLFRTGRPFNAGENNFAESIFPPTPETLQGAIRAAIATYWNPEKSIAEAFEDSDLRNLIGIYDKYGRFRVRGFSLGRYPKKNGLEAHSDGGNNAKDIECIFPMPSHILQEEGGKSQIRLIPRSQEVGIRTNMPDDLWLLHAEVDMNKTEGKLEPKKGWLTEQGLKTALWTSQDIDEDDIVKDEDIFVKEARLGIGMNNQTKTTEEGQLYQVQMIRMNHKPSSEHVYGFVVDISLDGEDDKVVQKKLNLPDYGWITLGGERRAAYFEVIHSKPTDEAQEKHTEGDLLYLATPAALDGGWQPAEWPTEHKPIAASIPRYQPIGGWQLKPGSYNNGTNKVMRRCVPAGSVYFFDKNISLDQPLTNYGKEIGYGITYIGGWKQ
jgi:CRISPR-associated protein Cmr3